MRRRLFTALAGGVVMAGAARARGQGRDTPVVGVLLSGASDGYYSTDELGAAIREGGVADVRLEVRAAAGQYERLPGLANELVALPVRVIVAFSLPAALAAKAATKAIPIVFTSGADPVAFGLVPNLNRPGGNLTGFTNHFGPLGAKRLELLRELAPKVGTVGVMINPDNPNASEHLQTVQMAARGLGLEIRVVRANSEAEIAAGFAQFAREGAGAVLVSDDPAYVGKAKTIVGEAARQRLPAIYHSSEFTAVGGLMSYGAKIADGVKVAGAYAARILRGAKAADLPVQQPAKFHLVINVGTARTLGLVVPAALLARADEVID